MRNMRDRVTRDPARTSRTAPGMRRSWGMRKATKHHFCMAAHGTRSRMQRDPSDILAWFSLAYLVSVCRAEGEVDGLQDGIRIKYSTFIVI